MVAGVVVGAGLAVAAAAVQLAVVSGCGRCCIAVVTVVTVVGV